MADVLIPQPPDGVPVWTLHWLYHPGAGGIWTVAEWDGAMWCLAGTRDPLDGWQYIGPAVPPKRAGTDAKAQPQRA